MVWIWQNFFRQMLILFLNIFEDYPFLVFVRNINCWEKLYPSLLNVVLGLFELGVITIKRGGKAKLLLGFLKNSSHDLHEGWEFRVPFVLNLTPLFSKSIFITFVWNNTTSDRIVKLSDIASESILAVWACFLITFTSYYLFHLHYIPWLISQEHHHYLDINSLIT